MKKKNSKSPKLRDIICNECGKIFQNYLTLKEINKRKHFCSKKCMYLYFHKHRKGITILVCPVCDKKFEAKNSEIKRSKCSIRCSKKCAGLEKKEKTMTTDGYWQISIGKGKHIKLHRWLMEQKIGRKLLSNEIVHHINFDKLDNRIENLKILTRSEHNSIHSYRNGKYTKKT